MIGNRWRRRRVVSVVELSSDVDLQPEEAGAPAGVACEADPVVDIERLFEDEYEKLVRVAVRLVDSRERAEEIVQESFEKALSRIDRLENPAAYLRTTVVNGCRGELRRREVRRRVLRRRTPVAELVEQREVLTDSLAALPPRRRIAIVLRYYLDLPEREIAAWMDIPPGTVKSLLSRGLDQLRDEVER